MAGGLEVADVFRRHGPAFRAARSEHLDRDQRRLVLVLHGRAGPVRYALIDTGRDWLLHRTKEQPGPVR